MAVLVESNTSLLEDEYGCVTEAAIAVASAASDHYENIVRVTDGEDYVTQDQRTRVLADEEGHRILFEGYLK